MNVYVETTESNYEFELQPITEFYGLNKHRKTTLLKNITRHFSSYKYLEFEESTSVYLDKELVGRKYFNCFYIQSREDLINYMSLSKNSILSNFVSKTLDSIDIQNEILKIDESLSKIYLLLNKIVETQIENIKLDYDYNSIWSIVQKSKIESSHYDSIEQLSNLELMLSLVKLLGEIQKLTGDKILIVVGNVESMFTSSEYKTLLLECQNQINKYDSWYIFEISQSSYAGFSNNYSKGITIFNNFDYMLPDFDHLTVFINNNYPCNASFKTFEIEKLVFECINSIGSNQYSSFGMSMIVDKLITNSLDVHKIKLDSLKDLERVYLFE